MRTAHDLVLFDLDGTISDPLVGIGRSITHALSHFGHAPLELDQLAVHIGPPLDEAFRVISGIQSHSELSALVAKFRECYADVGYSETALRTGADPQREAVAGETQCVFH